MKVPAWAYYTLHLALILWFISFIVGKDYPGAAMLLGGYLIGRALREQE